MLSSLTSFSKLQLDKKRKLAALTDALVAGVTHVLRLVLGRQLAEADPLAAFPKQVICDHYPVAARSMPEVWGWGEAWSES